MPYHVTCVCRPRTEGMLKWLRYSATEWVPLRPAPVTSGSSMGSALAESSRRPLHPDACRLPTAAIPASYGVSAAGIVAKARLVFFLSFRHASFCLFERPRAVLARGPKRWDDNATKTTAPSALFAVLACKRARRTCVVAPRSKRRQGSLLRQHKQQTAIPQMLFLVFKAPHKKTAEVR